MRTKHNPLTGNNLKILRAKSANLYFYNLKTIFCYLCYKAFKNIYLLILATCIIIFFSLVFYDFFFNCKHSSIAFICMSVLSICFLPAFVVSVDVECREHQLYKQRHCYCPKIDKLITEHFYYFPLFFFGL